jgi:protein-L-isoaspartate(D-aspartate) O-methyltransferase
VNVLEDRGRMVDLQLAGRGISDTRILDAFGRVPREAFLPPELAELAHDDRPLPIEGGQTISQPYIVALMAEALDLGGGERVLEIGTGSGYAAAILACLAKEVFSVERLQPLADVARERLARLGFHNVQVLCADGTLGWPEHAPYDAIVVAAGGPEIPRALLSQLSARGRLIIPVGADESSQSLVRATREGSGFRQDVLSEVRFVPLIGEQGWPDKPRIIRAPRLSTGSRGLAKLVRESAEPIDDVDSASVDALLERVGNARVVLLGEATHGTSEFYRMRAHITRELIDRAGFDFVAVEADWPDAARIDEYVMGDPRRSKVEFTPFSRFPTWMWRNAEVEEFVAWLRARNLKHPERTERAGFHGLDLYSMFTSIAAVLTYLDEVDPDAARTARARYSLLAPWQEDPAGYGQAVLVGRTGSSEAAVVAMLQHMLEERLDYARADGERFFDAAQNARVVANAERYYRAMYYASAASWNLRDTHMFDTLQSLFAFYGPDSRGVVWEHNSHIGNAMATEMSTRGELNVGQLCKKAYGERAYSVGFGTDHGTVGAASNWDEPMERMQVRPAHPESYERIFHDSSLRGFLLPLRDPKRSAIRDELLPPRLERAIGVVYRPETELASHYFLASMPHQFDELVWFDETNAVEPVEIRGAPTPGVPETYPFGL